jgi:hypothetical protein
MGVDIIVIACHISRVVKTRELKMFDFVAKRVEAGVPVWGLFEGGSEVGVLTDFDGEGFVATIETRIGEEYTFRGDVIADVLADCRKAYVKDYEFAEAEIRDLEVADTGRYVVAA